MTTVRTLIFSIAVSGILATTCSAQQSPQYVPSGPFKSVHLMEVSPAQEASLLAVVRDYNRVFAEQGCAGCVYRLFKMFSAKENKFSYMMTADWPSRDVYEKIHMSAAYVGVTNKNPVVGDISATEYYGRFQEVK